jgi:hypothetical protein
MTTLQLAPQTQYAICHALCHQKPFNLKIEDDHHLHYHPLSLAGRIWHLFDKTYHRNLKDQVAKTLITCLRNTPRELHDRAPGLPIVKITRLFLKYVGRKECSEPLKSEIKKELMALKLGLESELFEHEINQGFLAFASFPPLERYLAVYRHQLQVEPTSGAIQLLYQGQYSSWHTIRPHVSQSSPPPNPYQPWYYGPFGLQNKNMYDWESLTPFKYEDPALWNHQYVIEFCCCCEDKPRRTGDHTWIRLKTPIGEVYSVGLYRPEKNSWLDNYKAPFRVKKAFLMQPDVSEFWPTPIHTVAVAITQQQFELMKCTIEADKRSDLQTFQIVKSNCTLYAAKIGRLAGIHLPTAKPGWRVLFPQRFVRLCDKLDPFMPRFIKKSLSFITAFFLNTIQWMLGANKVDKAIESDSVQPAMPSFRDLADVRNAHIHHPYTLGHDIRPYVENWRQNELNQNSQQSDLQQRQIAFEIPQDWRSRTGPT